MQVIGASLDKTIIIQRYSLIVVAFCLVGCFSPGLFAAEDILPLRITAQAVLKLDAKGLELRYPGAIFYDSAQDEMVVIDSGNNQLVVYSLDFFPKYCFGKGRGLQAVMNYFIHDDRAYALLGQTDERKGGLIRQFDRALLPVQDIVFHGFAGAEIFIPREMTVGSNGKLYVAGNDDHGCIVLDSSGRFSHVLQPFDEVLGVKEKVKINSVVRGASGRLYLLSEEVSKVFVYDENENFLYQFGQKGGVQGKLSRPRGLAVDEENGRIFIVDFMRHAVSVYSLQGDFLLELGGMGGERGWFYFPSDVALDRYGRLWVTDTFNQRVQVFSVKN
ncbi:hypothetical protein AOP6_1130 [Desulfuromonas sp. AOP6]|nr:hypothetical protein AOP6_1130 [Desulfuromonas sp. AOP6]